MRGDDATEQDIYTMQIFASEVRLERKAASLQEVHYSLKDAEG